MNAGSLDRIRAGMVAAPASLDRCELAVTGAEIDGEAAHP